MARPVIPVVPQTITVHLGGPDSYAQNVTVPFIDYIKNVASSEIYPTWDENALVANILAQTSFALNRVYTEFYRSRGKDFDITNSTAIDQKFIYGRNIFENISRLVDEHFNDYIRRKGFVEPLAAKYCNGTTVTCRGLSQWGSEYLAQDGVQYFEILQRYYGYNIEIVTNAPVEHIPESYPGYPLRVGSRGADVVKFQTALNRISTAYPAIPKINPVDGIFGKQTESAVKKFQEIFNLVPDGIVGKATWYKIINLYVGLLRLSELNSEGQKYYGYNLKYPDAIAQGDRGEKVSNLQFFLTTIAEFNPSQIAVPVTGYFGDQTLQAVLNYQADNNLPQTGVVDDITWNSIYDTFEGIQRSEFTESDGRVQINFSPFVKDLSVGDTGQSVLTLQQQLNYIALVYRTISQVNPTGTFGEQTKMVVNQFQKEYDLPQTGIVDRDTWNSISQKYIDALSAFFTHPTQFPGRDMVLNDSDAKINL